MNSIVPKLGERKCPPAGIYDIEVAYFDINRIDSRIGIVFQLAYGPFKGFQFLERYALADPIYHSLKHRLEIDCPDRVSEPRPAAAVHLQRRVVNGYKTLGIKRVGG
jgi:hypothetical protein